MKPNTYDSEKVTKGVELVLEGMGINWQEEENFIETPQRVTRAFKELTQGLYEDFNNVKTFNSKYTGMIYFDSVRAVGLCPHHLLPIKYDISFAYIPNGKVLGLSKIPRIIKHLTARPVLQEDLTKEINEYFEQKLKPSGVAVLVRGIHGCMQYRGVKEAQEIKTVEFSGEFHKELVKKEDFYAMINKGI